MRIPRERIVGALMFGFFAMREDSEQEVAEDTEEYRRKRDMIPVRIESINPR
jgi:hypothetical protein